MLKRQFLLCMFAVISGCGGAEDSAAPPVQTTDPSPMRLEAPFDASAANDAQTAWANYLGVEKTVTNNVGMRFHLIPPGRFEMGSTKQECEQAFRQWPDLEREWLFREYPKHTVIISHPFYLATCEVTVGQFRQFIKATGRKTNNAWLRPGFAQTDDHPVANISWHDAQTFASWLSRDGVVYRLPTAAEWEYACRAGTTTRFPHGEDAEGLRHIGNVADATLASHYSRPVPERINESDGFAYTAPFGQFAANQFGIYDMIGNVHEWCQDWHGATFYQHSPTNDPRGPQRGEMRVCRGGGWHEGPRECRSANRGWLPPSAQYFNLGFRLVRVIATN